MTKRCDLDPAACALCRETRPLRSDFSSERLTRSATAAPLSIISSAIFSRSARAAANSATDSYPDVAYLREAITLATCANTSSCENDSPRSSCAKPSSTSGLAHADHHRPGRRRASSARSPPRPPPRCWRSRQRRRGPEATPDVYRRAQCACRERSDLAVLGQCTAAPAACPNSSLSSSGCPRIDPTTGYGPKPLNLIRCGSTAASPSRRFLSSS